jgi:hypothetical protein
VSVKACEHCIHRIWRRVTGHGDVQGTQSEPVFRACCNLRSPPSCPRSGPRGTQTARIRHIDSTALCSTTCFTILRRGSFNGTLCIQCSRHFAGGFTDDQIEALEGGAPCRQPRPIFWPPACDRPTLRPIIRVGENLRVGVSHPSRGESFRWGRGDSFRLLLAPVCGFVRIRRCTAGSGLTARAHGQVQKVGCSQNLERAAERARAHARAPARSKHASTYMHTLR